MTEPTELYRKYRPTTFTDVIGQDEVITQLKADGKRGAIAHCILFSGPSGTGKTTLARILRRKLKCVDIDYMEVNAAQSRGIDMVRDIQIRINLAPMGGKTRVWVCDEAHKLTSDAQSAFLKMLEDTPNHVYFMLCTTDPHKLLPTIRTRTTEYKLSAVGPKDMAKVLDRVVYNEGLHIFEDVIDKIVNVADGSPRKALVLLHQIAGIEDEEAQLAAISKADYQAQGIELCRALGKGSGWGQIAKILNGLDDDAEAIRYQVLGYARKIMLGGGKGAGRAADIVDAFADNFYDSKQAGLALACWEIIHGSDG